MDALTVIVASLLRKHPVGVPYVMVCLFVVVLLGLHPW